jgi:hypothetical protein
MSHAKAPRGPEETERARLGATLEQLRAHPPQDAGAARALCETAGALRAMGVRITPLSAQLQQSLADVLEKGLGLASLSTEAQLVVELLDLLEARDDADDAPSAALARDEEELVRSALGARDRAELLLLGLEALGLDAHALDATDALGIATFDAYFERVRARATRLNHVRGESTLTILPPLRARFPWRFEGIGIDPQAWSSLATVAGLVARYPEAAARLEALVRVERALASAPRATDELADDDGGAP